MAVESAIFEARNFWPSFDFGSQIFYGLYFCCYSFNQTNCVSPNFFSDIQLLANQPLASWFQLLAALNKSSTRMVGATTWSLCYTTGSPRLPSLAVHPLTLIRCSLCLTSVLMMAEVKYTFLFLPSAQRTRSWPTGKSCSPKKSLRTESKRFKGWRIWGAWVLGVGLQPLGFPLYCPIFS